MFIVTGNEKGENQFEKRLSKVFDFKYICTGLESCTRLWSGGNCTVLLYICHCHGVNAVILKASWISWSTKGASITISRRRGSQCGRSDTQVTERQRVRKPFGDGFGDTAAAAKSLQCRILCDPIDGSPPGSPVLGILQARTLEWVAISFSNA